MYNAYYTRKSCCTAMVCYTKRRWVGGKSSSSDPHGTSGNTLLPCKKTPSQSIRNNKPMSQRSACTPGPYMAPPCDETCTPITRARLNNQPHLTPTQNNCTAPRGLRHHPRMTLLPAYHLGKETVSGDRYKRINTKIRSVNDL